MNKKCIVGLTGQSGSGKTTVSEIFEQNGFYVINCDIVSRKVTEKGSDCCRKLAEIFPDCFDEELSLNRKALGQVVFGDAHKLNKLNETIFPYIIREVEGISKKSNSDYILLDAPTLFDAKMESECNCIVSVIADEKLRLKRIMIRDGLDESSVLKRFASQRSQQFFIDNSDYIIENNGDAVDLEHKTVAVIRKIKEMADVC